MILPSQAGVALGAAAAGDVVAAGDAAACTADAAGVVAPGGVASDGPAHATNRAANKTSVTRSTEPPEPTVAMRIIDRPHRETIPEEAIGRVVINSEA
ncbi:MAG: hypothetical protein V3R95_03015 [Dehalococcoidia bacterium]